MPEEQGGRSIEEYIKANEGSPFTTFFDGLTGRNRDQAIALLAALRELGNMLRPPRSKKLEDNLFELRGHQVRVFYMFLPGRRVVLLDGIVKKQDEIPRQDMKRVRAYKREVEESQKSTGD